jgi:hypothetical protein
MHDQWHFGETLCCVAMILRHGGDTCRKGRARLTRTASEKHYADSMDKGSPGLLVIDLGIAFGTGLYELRFVPLSASSVSQEQSITSTSPNHPKNPDHRSL